METIATGRGDRSAVGGALVARVTVQTSVVAAAAAGVWLLQRGSPAVATAAAVLFLATFLAARWRFGVANALVLVFAYTSTGLLLLLLPSFPATSFWLAAVAGLVAGGCSWTTWNAPAVWRWPLMLWLLGVALSWPIIAAREADFTAVLPGDAVGVIVMNALITLCAGVWLESALTWDVPATERRVAWPLLASVLLSAAVVFYQRFVDITWLSGDVWIQLQRAPGLMGDANPMAVAAALWAPLAPLLLRDRLRAVGLVLTLLLWSAAWLTGARTVLVLVAAGAIGLIGGVIAERTTPRRALAFVALGVMSALALVALLAQQPIGGPIGRLASTLPLDRPIDLVYEVLWRRDGYGLAAVRAIEEQPWSGVGTGAFYAVSTYYHRLDGGETIPPDNAQNLWRQALAERGLLAFPAVVVLTVATVGLLARRAAHVPLTYAWTLKAVVIGLGVVLIFGYPVQNPAIAFTAAALLAWLHATVTPRPFRVAPPLSTVAIGAIWLLALGGALVDLHHARGDLRPPWRAARVGDLYLYGFGEIEGGPREASGRVVTDYAVAALRTTGPRYLLRTWVRGSDARHLRVWQNRRLIMDELLPAGVIIERPLDTAAGDGMLLEFATDEPGIVVTGEFVR